MPKHTGIRKLSNGRFRARYFAGYDKQGKRRYPAKTFDTQRQAIDWRAEHVAAKGPGTVAGTGLTVGAFLNQWLASKYQLRENTRQSYRDVIDRYIAPGLGRVKLAKLTASQVEQWQGELLKHVGPSTVSGARTILFGACKKAVRMNLIRGNPVEGTDSPGRGKPKKYALSIEEALTILEACSRAKFGVFFELALTCGLRPEELLGLQWQDLELTNQSGIVRVRRVVHSKRGGGWLWQEPKTKSGNRNIVFPGDLAARLLEHRKAQRELQLKAGRYWKANDLVFATPVGEPINYSIVKRYFRKMIGAAGLSGEITMYSLRHFFVTSSLIAGVDAKTVSSEAGHASVSFTLDRYGSVLEEMHQTASEKRERLLRNRKG